MNSQDYMKLDDQYAAHTYHPIEVVVCILLRAPSIPRLWAMGLWCPRPTPQKKHPTPDIAEQSFIGALALTLAHCRQM